MKNLSLKKRKICRCSWSKNALPWHANLRDLFSLSHTLAVKAQKFKRNLSPAVGPFPKGTGALSSIYRPPKLVIGSKSVLKTNQISLATGLIPSLVWIWVLSKHSMFPLLLRSSLFSTRDSSLSLPLTHTQTHTNTHAQICRLVRLSFKAAPTLNKESVWCCEASLKAASTKLRLTHLIRELHSALHHWGRSAEAD